MMFHLESWPAYRQAETLSQISVSPWTNCLGHTLTHSLTHSLGTQGQLSGAISDCKMMEIEVFISSKAPNLFPTPTLEGLESKIFSHNS